MRFVEEMRYCYFQPNLIYKPQIHAFLINATNWFFLGNFPTLAISFRLKRHIGYYIIQDFIPTALIVTLSWVGFWINEQSVPARVSLGITTVLAITTLTFGVQASLPKVGYVKAIDFYLLGSFLFVFGALVEFAVICTVTDLREEKSRHTSERHNDSTRDPSTRDSSTILASGFNSPSMVFKEPKVAFKKILIFNHLITFFLSTPCLLCRSFYWKFCEVCFPKAASYLEHFSG